MRQKGTSYLLCTRSNVVLVCQLRVKCRLTTTHTTKRVAYISWCVPKLRRAMDGKQKAAVFFHHPCLDSPRTDPSREVCRPVSATSFFLDLKRKLTLFMSSMEGAAFALEHTLIGHYVSHLACYPPTPSPSLSTPPCPTLSLTRQSAATRSLAVYHDTHLDGLIYRQGNRGCLPSAPFNFHSLIRGRRGFVRIVIDARHPTTQRRPVTDTGSREFLHPTRPHHGRRTPPIAKQRLRTSPEPRTWMVLASFVSSSEGKGVARAEACGGGGGDKRGDCFESSMFSASSEGGDVWVRDGCS